MTFIRQCKAGREGKELVALQNILQADNNLSLAQCAIQHLIQRRIINLNSIFITIPVSLLRIREPPVEIIKLQQSISIRTDP
jgi:hypothetical protein